MSMYEKEMEKLASVKPGEFVQLRIPIPEIAACLNALPKKKYALIEIVQTPLDMPQLILQNVESAAKASEKASGKEGDK